MYLTVNKFKHLLSVVISVPLHVFSMLRHNSRQIVHIVALLHNTHKSIGVHQQSSVQFEVFLS